MTTTAPRQAAVHLITAVVGSAVDDAEWLDDVAAEVLAFVGQRVRAQSPAAQLGLSPQEWQIALLATEGLTNREIGGRLHLSHRTVGSHLYRLFPKLGIRSRAQLHRALLAP